MKPCTQYLDELALAAGGDLPVDEERLVLIHAEACEACAAFLAGLIADQGALARVALQREAVESLVPAVMARVATEAHERAVREALAAQAGQSLSRAGRGILRAGIGQQSRHATFGPFARMAAVMAVVVSAGLLGLAALQQDEALQQDASLQHDASADGPQMAVRRLPGPSDAIELSWAGDGREGSEEGAGRPYTVLASADPRNFTGAKEVEVAGRRLVTDLPLPAARAKDRKVTYFRVQ